MKVIAILDVIKSCTCSYTAAPAHYVFWYPAVAHIVTHSVNLAFGLNRASKINVGLGPGSGFKVKPIYNSAPAIYHQNVCMYKQKRSLIVQGDTKKTVITKNRITSKIYLDWHKTSAKVGQAFVADISKVSSLYCKNSLFH